MGVDVGDFVGGDRSGVRRGDRDGGQGANQGRRPAGITADEQRDRAQQAQGRAKQPSAQGRKARGGARPAVPREPGLRGRVDGLGLRGEERETSQSSRGSESTASSSRTIQVSVTSGNRDVTYAIRIDPRPRVSGDAEGRGSGYRRIDVAAEPELELQQGPKLAGVVGPARRGGPSIRASIACSRNMPAVRATIGSSRTSLGSVRSRPRNQSASGTEKPIFGRSRM